MPRNTRRSTYRRLDSRVRVQRIVQQQRVPVIRAQLDAMRARLP